MKIEERIIEFAFRLSISGQKGVLGIESYYVWLSIKTKVKDIKAMDIYMNSRVYTTFNTCEKTLKRQTSRHYN